MPTIIVEDGTGTLAANSYISLAEVRAFALDRGVTLSNDDDEVGVLLIKANDWLESQEYIGQPEFTEDPVQVLKWPRVINDVSVGIPTKVKHAQAFAAMEVANQIDLMPTVVPSADYVTKEKIGELEQQYARPQLSQLFQGPRLTAALSCLKPYLSNYSNSFFTQRA